MWGSLFSPVGPTGAWDPPLEVCSLETVWLLRVALGSVIEISRGQVINYVFNNVFEKPSTNNHRSKQCNRNNCSLIGNKFIKLFGTQPYEVKLQPLIGRVGFPLFSRKPPSFRHRGAGIPPNIESCVSFSFYRQGPWKAWVPCVFAEAPIESPPGRRDPPHHPGLGPVPQIRSPAELD